jgi:hypothetical protein
MHLPRALCVDEYHERFAGRVVSWPSGWLTRRQKSAFFSGEKPFFYPKYLPKNKRFTPKKKFTPNFGL